MAAGTLKPNILQLEGRTLEGIVHGLPFLLDVNDQRRTDLTGDIVVIGGGFTAMDCARTAARMGSRSVKVLYRRSRDEMLVTKEELMELEHEEIPIEFMVTPVGYSGNGSVSSVNFIRTELGDIDASGRRRPVEIPGTEFELSASSVLLATGQFPETDWIGDDFHQTLVNESGWLKSGESVTTEIDSVFVAGDFALGATTLIDSIGHAKKCARAVDSFLMKEERLADVVRIDDIDENDRDSNSNQIELHSMPTIPVEERSLTAEVESGYVKPDAKEEALRCYLCHYKYEIDNDLCIYCDGCLRVKPVENCIVKVSSLTHDDAGRIIGYEESKSSMDYNLLYIDQNECIRCNACLEICPVECISVQKVSKTTVPASEISDF